MKVRTSLCIVLSLLGVGLFTGCGNPKLKEMTKPVWIPETASWPELDELDRDPDTAGGLERIQKLLSEGDGEVGAYIQTLLSKQSPFGARLKKFEETPIPAKYDTPQRQTAKKEYIDAWKELEKSGKTGADPKKIRALITGMNKLKARVKYIPDQVVPTGSEVEKWSSISIYENPYAN